MTETITLGVQSGGDDDRTNEHVLELRKLLAAYCKGPYSEQIDTANKSPNLLSF